MKQLILGAMIIGLTGCSSSPERFGSGADSRTVNVSSSSSPQQVISPAQPAIERVSRAIPFAFGPIKQACLASDRKRRSAALCGCVQHAANETLSAPQQRRAVTFYSNPEQAQIVRQSNRSSDERFWSAYKIYGDRAEALCR